MDNENVGYGLCHCGCGQKTNIIKKSQKKMGIVKGEPRKYLVGHMVKGRKFPQKSGENHCRWNGGRSTDPRGYTRVSLPSHPRSNSMGYVHEHIVFATNALGKPLPPKAVVHHHTPDQLVVCQDQAYHNLLHKRMKAVKECGHANWLRCPFCHEYDDPNNMRVYEGKRTRGHHVSCFDNYRWKRKQHRVLRAAKNVIESPTMTTLAALAWAVRDAEGVTLEQAQKLHEEAVALAERIKNMPEPVRVGLWDEEINP